MLAAHTSADEILIAIPMVGIMLAGFFRLDEYWSKPQGAKHKPRPFSQWDAGGDPICVEPDGTLYRGPKRRR